MDQNYVQVLIDTMVKKEETLRKILDITKQQEVLSKQDEYSSEDMEGTLNEKEIQIARLNYLDEGFQSVYDRVGSEIRNHIDTYREDVLELQDRIRVCTELGNEIMVMEERNRNRFSVLFSKAHAEYSSTKNQANVAQNYFKTMSNSKVMDSYFVDKKQ
ncbi:MAG: flagellar protein FlgN [Clostridium sp.]|nr:flagellar protein FlgN [Clostridium sp.]